MKTLSEMTTSELWSLRDDVDAKINRLIDRGIRSIEIQQFRCAIDDELDRRGA